MMVAIYLLGVFTVVLVMLSSYFFGEKSNNPARNSPYEGGIVSTGTARVRYFNQYFLVAMLFVIFDIESIFLYVWAVSVREVGWPGFFQIFFFAGMLLLALVYVFSMGVLKFAQPSSKRFSKNLN